MAINDEIPKSRITLTYRTAVNGETEDVQLPLRLLMMGDFSNGTSKDQENDLEQREIRNLDGRNLNALMSDMQMAIRFDVPNCINPEASEMLPIELPITSMDSFSPASIAKKTPKVNALLLLRKLLLEVQGNLDNRKDFRKMLRALAQDESAMKKLMSELAEFDNFKVPKKIDAPPSSIGDGSPADNGESEAGV